MTGEREGSAGKIIKAMKKKTGQTRKKEKLGSIGEGSRDGPRANLHRRERDNTANARDLKRA